MVHAQLHMEANGVSDQIIVAQNTTATKLFIFSNICLKHPQLQHPRTFTLESSHYHSGWGLRTDRDLKFEGSLTCVIFQIGHIEGESGNIAKPKTCI